MKIITDSRCTEYSRPGHPERPQRVAKTVDHLREQKELGLDWLAPLPVSEEALLRAHSRSHLTHVHESSHDFDADTPSYPRIYEHALRSVGGAMHALKLAREGELAFSLLRPPGHHATRDEAMGFCYLNSVAIGALEGQAIGFAKVAVFDFDVHHGNGTEAILLDRPDCAYFSVHQFPAYPGTGAESIKNSHNFPVVPGANRDAYRDALKRAFDQLSRFNPDLVAVSAGFDAYRRDPLSDEPLEAEDFHWIGRQLREMKMVTFSLLEGGYSSNLPELVLAYLKGWSGLG